MSYGGSETVLRSKTLELITEGKNYNNDNYFQAYHSLNHHKNIGI